MFETNQSRRSTPRFGTSVSLVLHACLVPLALWMAQSPQLHRIAERQLNIQMIGPQANRQMVELQKRMSAPPSAPAPQKQEQQEDPKPKPTPLKTVSVELSVLKIAPSENHNDSPNALHLPEMAAAPIDFSHAAGGRPSRSGNSEYEQRAQSVGRQLTDADLINAYISVLTKLVNSHLIYPKDVRKKKLEGVSWVSFVVTESGALKPNSLQIKKSSGYQALDDNALKTILAVAPFQRPPRELNLSIALEFEVD